VGEGWEGSIVESHPPSPARDAAVAALAPALPALERWAAGTGGEAAVALRAAGLEGSRRCQLRRFEAL
jgi:hypothetical protein